MEQHHWSMFACSSNSGAEDDSMAYDSQGLSAERHVSKVGPFSVDFDRILTDLDF